MIIREYHMRTQVLSADFANFETRIHVVFVYRVKKQFNRIQASQEYGEVDTSPQKLEKHITAHAQSQRSMGCGGRFALDRARDLTRSGEA